MCHDHTVICMLLHSCALLFVLSDLLLVVVIVCVCSTVVEPCWCPLTLSAKTAVLQRPPSMMCSLWLPSRRWMNRGTCHPTNVCVFGWHIMVHIWCSSLAAVVMHCLWGIQSFSFIAIGASASRDCSPFITRTLQHLHAVTFARTLKT